MAERNEFLEQRIEELEERGQQRDEEIETVKSGLSFPMPKTLATIAIVFIAGFIWYQRDAKLTNIQTSIVNVSDVVIENQQKIAANASEIKRLEDLRVAELSFQAQINEEIQNAVDDIQKNFLMHDRNASFQKVREIETRQDLLKNQQYTFINQK